MERRLSRWPANEVAKAAYVRLFASGTFNTSFFPRVAFADTPATVACTADFEAAKTIGGKMDENLQELAFIRWLNKSYPLTQQTPLREQRRIRRSGTLQQQTAAAAPDFVFLPFCWFADALARHRALTIPNATNLDSASFTRTQLRVRSDAASKVVDNVLAAVDAHQCFYVMVVPLLYPSWRSGSPLRRCRALIVDRTLSGALQDIAVPYTAFNESLARLGAARLRTVLLAGCGHYRFYGQFKDLRQNVFRRLNALHLPELDVSAFRSHAGYLRAFTSARYCLIIPGDTASTAMSTRAILGGCVPVFVIDEWRELPFARVLDYSLFSVRVRPRSLLCSGCAAGFVSRLNHTLDDGTYEKLAAGVESARDFFDYAREGPRSPCMERR